MTKGQVIKLGKCTLQEYDEIHQKSKLRLKMTETQAEYARRKNEETLRKLAESKGVSYEDFVSDEPTKVLSKEEIITRDKNTLMSVKEKIDKLRGIESKENKKNKKMSTKLSQFVYVDELEKALSLALAAGENIILYGKGGHGKSEYTEEFFRSRNIEPYVKTMGSGTTTDILFGGIDIKMMTDTGKIEYLVENSFMNHEYVVFEELFDAPDYILEQLKDILTSKRFRNGTQNFPIKTKLIVCCTNKTREEFSKNDSLKALMERFPLEYKVEWKAYNKVTYEHLFRNVMGKPFSELAYILERLHVAGTTVSPRTAVKSAKMIDSCGGMDCLDFIADFSGKNKQLVQTERAKFVNVRIILNVMNDCDKLVDQISGINLNTNESIDTAISLTKSLKHSYEGIKNKKIDDQMLGEVRQRSSAYESFIKQIEQNIKNATKV